VLVPLAPEDVPALREFLVRADLTQSGLDEESVHLWLLRDAHGTIIGTTGYELAGPHALIRSVAVDDSQRGLGTGTRLALHAMTRAARSGARTAWLFSRRSGPFWQRLGFEPADVPTLATALATTHQVTEFTTTGRLPLELAWTRPLTGR
jgi:N-acetylglutamate synthase-like GNAT family acetyltransferase